MKAENYTRKLLGLDQNRDWKSFGSAKNKYRDAMKIVTQNGWRSCSSETEKEVRATRLDKILSRNPQTIFFFKRSNESITKIKHAYLIEAYFSGFRALTEITNLIFLTYTSHGTLNILTNTNLQTQMLFARSSLRGQVRRWSDPWLRLLGPERWAIYLRSRWEAGSGLYLNRAGKVTSHRGM